MNAIRACVVCSAALLFGIAGLSGRAIGAPGMVPNDLKFWDNSENWTTDYGPAYRDTVLQPQNMVACSGKYALCFTSGPEPFPCVPSNDGRSAECTCTEQTGLNFVLISAILNWDVYEDTVNTCGADGAGCGVENVNKAPVCAAINSGKLIPGADLISTFHPTSRQDVIDILEGTTTPVPCAKAPYAACMTAPCKQKKGGYPVCTCPVFDGVFQLPTPGANCDAGDGLIPSSSFSPKVLSQ
jgi:hypothetical protein